MKKIILIILLAVFSYASIITTVSSKNLQVLNSFDIESNFIEDKKTNKLYQSYLKSKKRYFLNILENGYSYIPLIKKEIKKAHIPADIVFVAMAESNFLTRARSNKKATGLWQFIPSTARHFGLKINDYVDERKDPIKSTITAIKYLSELKKATGKWYLAIMSYNCGEARVIEGITRAKLDKYCQTHNCKTKEIKTLRKNIKRYQYNKAPFYVLWRTFKKVNKLYPKDITLNDLLKVQKRLQRQYLPQETRQYIRKIIAMSFLLNSNNFVKYQNHYLLNRGSMSNLIKVDVPAGTSLGYISKLLHIDYASLRSHNMHLKYGFTPPHEDSYIYLPYEKLAMFRLNFNNKKIARKIIYKVKRGDTLASISRKFKIRYKVIKDFNHLHTNLLRINQRLVIPIKHNIKIKKNIVYRVKRGDTLASISRKFNTSYNKIIKLNRLKSNTIYKNQKLVIPVYVRID